MHAPKQAVVIRRLD